MSISSPETMIFFSDAFDDLALVPGSEAGPLFVKIDGFGHDSSAESFFGISSASPRLAIWGVQP